MISTHGYIHRYPCPRQACNNQNEDRIYTIEVGLSLERNSPLVEASVSVRRTDDLGRGDTGERSESQVSILLALRLTSSAWLLQACRGYGYPWIYP